MKEEEKHPTLATFDEVVPEQPRTHLEARLQCPQLKVQTGPLLSTKKFAQACESTKAFQGKTLQGKKKPRAEILADARTFKKVRMEVSPPEQHPLPKQRLVAENGEDFQDDFDYWRHVLHRCFRNLNEGLAAFIARQDTRPWDAAHDELKKVIDELHEERHRVVIRKQDVRVIINGDGFYSGLEITGTSTVYGLTPGDTSKAPKGSG